MYAGLKMRVQKNPRNSQVCRGHNHLAYICTAEQDIHTIIQKWYKGALLHIVLSLLFLVLSSILLISYRTSRTVNYNNPHFLFRIFEMVSYYCEDYSNLIPMSFVLGFYVSIVVARWWKQLSKIPFPDRMALFITANMQGQDDRGRLMRRTLMRYLCLSFVITLSSISPPVKKRFPTFSRMKEAGKNWA